MGKVLLLPLLGLVFAAVIRVAEAQYEGPQPDWPETDEDYDDDEDERRKRSTGELYEISPPEWPETDEEADDENRRKRSSGDYDYALAVHDSILFYEAQRSGKLPEDNRIPWRADSALDDHGEHGEDLTGGWYDAGDHVKFNLPMAFSTTMIAWGVIEFEDAYRDAGELEHVRKSIKWTCDYFIKCHTGPEEYYYQVANPNIDHRYWVRPENMTMERPAYKCGPTVPCSDVAAETAAALTACSIVFKDEDPDYSTECLSHAVDLYKFASTYVGVYPLETYYPSRSCWDEMAWAAAWLYRATNEANYLADSERLYAEYRLKVRAYAFGWGDKKPGIQLLLYSLTGNGAYKKKFKNYVDNWLPGNRLTYTPKGLVLRHSWGSNRFAANTAAAAILGARYGVEPVDSYVAWAKSQIGYILGDGGHSFMVGFGEAPPERPHHRSSSCPDFGVRCTVKNGLKYNGPNHHPLVGAIVGGVDTSDWWSDNRGDYVQNEVACDYNAGFQTATIGLHHFKMQGNPAFA